MVTSNQILEYHSEIVEGTARAYVLVSPINVSKATKRQQHCWTEIVPKLI